MKNKKTFKLFIESIIDVKRINYSNSIFDNHDTDEPSLKPEVKRQILSGISKLNDIAKVKEYQLIGSILTKQYNDTADLDINVVFDVPENEQESKFVELFAAIRMMNGEKVTGTRHPINYYVIMNDELRDVAFNRADNIYDIQTDKFIKRKSSDNLEPINVHAYLDKFKSQISKIDILKNQFNRDLIDYKEYRSLSKDEVYGLHSLLSKQIKTLEKDINELIDKEEDIHAKRRAAFAKDLTKEELQKYGSHNRLPENILYKILERYHYLDFINHLKDVIGDDRKLTQDEADQL